MTLCVLLAKHIWRTDTLTVDKAANAPGRASIFLEFRTLRTCERRHGQIFELGIGDSVAIFPGRPFLELEGASFFSVEAQRPTHRQNVLKLLVVYTTNRWSMLVYAPIDSKNNHTKIPYFGQMTSQQTEYAH